MQKLLTGYGETVSLLIPSRSFSAIDTFCDLLGGFIHNYQIKEENLYPVCPNLKYGVSQNLFWALVAAVIMDLRARLSPMKEVFRVASANLVNSQGHIYA